MSTNGISVILGTLNEEENIQILLDNFDVAIKKNNLFQINEIVIVDDGSKDKTVEIILANKSMGHSFDIKLVERREKMGMVNADIIGSQNASNSTVIIMDSDLQHPVDTIPKMVDAARKGADMVIASRYVKGGKNNWSPMRGFVSRSAVFVSHLFLKNSRRLKDPISGFFMVDKRYLTNLIPYRDSYKLALYILSAHDSIRVVEIPFRMGARKNGESKIVDKNFSFLIKYLIEIARYWRAGKVKKDKSPKNRGRATYRF